MTTAWNLMQVEIIPADLLIRPIVGPGGMTRRQALAEVQGLLDRIPALSGIADTWRCGARDDTVYAGPLVWTIYEYPAGEDLRRAAMAWLEDYAQTMRAAGLDVQVARLL